jgi:hypothetical protein
VLRRDRVAVAGALVLAALAAAPVRAQGVRPFIPVSARARLDLSIFTTEGTAPWKWDAQSRSPLDGSRFMADMTAGDDRLGTLYLKGAANWRDTDDASGRVAFTLEQGDYLYRHALSKGVLSARLFGDERRYFTGELGTVLMEDDVVARFQHRLGALLHAGRGALGADYLASSLDGGEETQVLQRGAARLSAGVAHVAVAYQHTRPEEGEDRAVVQAEAAAYYRWLTGIVSFAQAGPGSGFFYPSGSFDTGAADGSGYVAAAPENSATSLEARVRRISLKDVRLDAIYQYQATGVAYVNELASTRPGSVSNSAGLYATHRRYAVEGRLLWRDETRFVIEDARVRSLEATARAFLRDNSQMLLRAGIERREFQGREEYDAGLVQGGYRRELQRFMGGVQAMLDGIGDDMTPRAGVEARVNWSATSALYARWIVAGEEERPSALYARLEFRPTGRTWVTVAYGWGNVGDSPYMLDDIDPIPSSGTRDAFTVTVRGDF